MPEDKPAKPNTDDELADLRERVAWFQSLVDNFNEAVYTMDSSGCIEFISQAAGDLAGYLPQDIIGRPYQDFVATGSLDRFSKHFAKVMAGQRQTGDFQVMGREGRLHWMRISSRPRTEGGRVVGAQGIVTDITDSKQMADALVQSEERHRSFIENLPQGVFRSYPDPDAIPLMVNQAMADMLGYKSIEELLQTQVVDHYADPKDREFLWSVLRKQDKIVGQEVQLRGRGGRKVWGAVTARVLRDQDGRAEFVEGTIEDITARKQAEEQLAAAQERWHTVFQTATDAIFIKNRSLKYLQVNQAMADLFHKTPVEMAGRDDLELFGGTQGRQIHELEQRVLAGEVVEEDQELLLPGRTATFAVARMPLRDSQGRVEGLVGIARDITERAASGVAIAESEERFRQLADNVKQVFWMTSPDFQKVHYVNEAFEETWGISRQEVYQDAAAWFSMVHPEDQPLLIGELQKMAGGDFGHQEVTEFRFTRADGDPRWASIRSAPVADEKGRVYRVVGVMEDITERKRTDKAIQTLVASTVGATGQEFFDRLVQTVCGWLGCEMALVGRIAGGQRVDCMAVQFDGSIQHGHSYSLEGTPCRQLLQGEVVIHRSNVADLFPDDSALRECGAESYFGIPLKDSGGQVIGVLCALWRSELVLPPRSEEVMGIMAARAGAEVARLQSDEKLRASEERFAKAFNSSPMLTGISTVAGGRFLEVNQAFVDKLGHSREEIIGHTSSELGLWHDLVQRQSAVDMLQEQGFVRGLEVTLVSKDGRKHEVVWAADTIEYEGQDCLIVTATDISELKQTKWDLEQSQATLHSIFQAAPVGIGFVSVPERTIHWANDLLAKMTGYSQEELTGMGALELYESEEEYLRVGREKHAHVRASGVGSVETRFKRKDGSVFDLLLSSAQIDPDDFDAGLVFTAMDLTAQHEAQREKENLAVQLRRSQKMESIGTLAGGVAHDFNNILGVVMGYCELAIVQAGEGRSFVPHLQEALEAVGRGKDLVKEILTFSRKGERKHTWLDLNRQVAKAAAMLKRTIPKMVEIELKLDEDLEPVMSNPTQVEQVIMNLGTNARDAMPDGGKLSITTRNVELDEEFCSGYVDLQPGGYALLQVSDTGHGMDDQVLENIFDPFFTSKGVGKGTGLGLSIVYGIVAGHKGHITCQSQPGAGTVFDIYLPLAAGPEAKPETVEFPVVQPAVGGNENVLLVDDEPGLLNIGRQILSGAGYQVITRSSGEEALETYTTSGADIDLVILDLNMPGMGGEAAYRKLSKQDPSLKAIISTGYPLSDQLQAEVDSGRAGYISKPFSSREMLSVVRRVLNRGS